jgi:hypothetical protein
MRASGGRRREAKPSGLWTGDGITRKKPAPPCARGASGFSKEKRNGLHVGFCFGQSGQFLPFPLTALFEQVKALETFENGAFGRARRG